MNPTTLKSAALSSIVKHTLQTVSAIECEESRFRKIYPMFVNDIEFHENTKSMISEVRTLLMDIPLPLIDEYVELVMKIFCIELKNFCSIPGEYNIRYAILLDIIPFYRLSTFSDKWIFIRSSSLSYIWAEFLYKKWVECSKSEELKFKKLSLCAIPLSITGMFNFRDMFKNFIHLTSLKILPISLSRFEKCSSNFVIELVSRYCLKLREFHLAYNGETLKNTESRIEDLVKCRNLVSLWLYDISPTTTVENVDGLQKLLIELKNLKCLFHKDLKLAILDPNDKISGTLGLEHLILRDDVFHDRDHKVILTTDEFVRLSKICPATRTLKLIKPPPCIDTVARAIPNLEILDMSICGDVILLGLSRALLQKNLKNLKVLKLKKVFDMDYTHISQLAHNCPNLEVLDISFSTIKANGDLILPPQQSSAFPHLRELTMIPNCNSTFFHMCSFGRCEYGIWGVGEKLTRYLLKGSHNLKSLHMHYDDSYYKPSSSFILEMLESLNCLASLQLVSSLDMHCKIIHQMITRCPMLKELAAFGCWNFKKHINQNLPVQINFKMYCECRDIKLFR
uniref:Uncharacterized protein n=1 Tax=Melicertus latisulcatus majanivirus TaxID=2984277 RepID=A0A9C7F6R7_9VIRU|nr:MAG: hypothetical protein [Melicertus latisulcatus majanivirus]